LYFLIGIPASLQSEFSLTPAGTKNPGQVTTGAHKTERRYRAGSWLPVPHHNSYAPDNFVNLARVGIKHGDLLYAALKITAYNNDRSARFLQALVNLRQTSLLARRETTLSYELHVQLK
jgi:hypothetical protein